MSAKGRPEREYRSAKREGSLVSAIAEPLLRVDGLVKHFPVRRGLFGRQTGAVRAVDGVSFEVEVGSTASVIAWTATLRDRRYRR